ncbi:MAG: LLM class flavin-dependent oxidoreductase [Chloroflexi bacterium]|nr:LLM class flavin-dependent oxidoreductase [Chloroflexota bacterium]
MARFGVYLPNVAWDGLASPQVIAEYALAAEELGLDSLWVEDRFLHRRVTVLEPLTTLTYVAARTRRIRLGTSILLVNLRNPLVVAKMLGTLDYLSGGRVVLGASLGGSPDEYAAAGVIMKTRVTRLVETLATMKALWAAEPVRREGTLFPLPGVPLGPQPQRQIPILLGGRVDAALQRAGTIADGWLASSGTTAEDFAVGWAKVQEAARSAGRDPATLEPAKFTYIHCAESAEDAFDVLSRALPQYYTAGYDIPRNCVYGPPERCAEQAQRLLDSGVRTLIFSPVTADRGQLETVATSVVPLLR